MSEITCHTRRLLATAALLACAACAAALFGCEGRTERTPENHTDGDAHEESSPAQHADQHTVELTPEAILSAHIRAGAAGPAEIALGAEAPGEVHLNAERVLEIRPRYSGVVREIRKRIGDPVQEGEVLAVVQSNESLADYEITSSMAGTVIARHVVAGQAVGHESILLTVADLSTVWVEFAIYPQYVGRIRAGLPVSIVVQDRPDLSATGTIRYVGPLLEQDTRVSSGRVELPNPERRWQPGLFVTVRVTFERVRVPVAVPDEAIVRTAEGPAVFLAEGLRFELRPVRVGRSDGRTTEIIDGIASGDSVVVSGGFILKSELGKGEVEHEH